VPIVARGAGTGTCGGAVPDAGGIVVSFARMDRILALRPEDRCAVVEPGVRTASCSRRWHRTACSGRRTRPAPSTAASAATSPPTPAARAVKYGTTRDNVLGLAAVTGAGELIRCGGPYTKDATGYDLTHLIVGSGTLA
jgi:D-lactate dehydrogenase